VVRLKQLEENYRQRASAVQSKVSALIVSYIMEELIVVREIEMYAKCTYHTARTALNTLSHLGIIEPFESEDPQKWWARELIAEVYEAETPRASANDR